MNPLLPGIRRGIEVSPIRSTVKLHLVGATTGSKSTKNMNKGLGNQMPMPKPRIIPGGVGSNQAKNVVRTKDST